MAAFSVSPLCVAAAPLLQLLAGLGTLRRAPDVWKLRERAVQELTAFERRAQDAGIAMDLLRPAHYALCASIDDVVLNTPWGATSGWANQALVKAYHATARGTDQFFEQLQQMRKAPQKFLPVIELMFLCLSLGFMGRYRQARGGELEQIRSEAHAAIATQSAATEPELSRRWRGVTVPYQPTHRGVPVWVAFAAAAAVCGGLLFWTSTSLNAASDSLAARALVAPPDHMPQVTRVAIVQPLPPSPPPAEPTARDRLRTSLQADIDRGAMTLIGTGDGADHPDRRRIDVRTRQRRGAVSVVAIAGAHRRRTAERKRVGESDRLHRQPAVQERALSLQLPALRRARERGARDHRARCG